MSSDNTFGQRVADKVADTMGSWYFVAIQSTILIIWIICNISGLLVWDAPPFILLNLILSFQAAYTAPMIMMSQNSDTRRDRLQAKKDYEINIKAEDENQKILTKINQLEEKIDRLLRKEE